MDTQVRIFTKTTDQVNIDVSLALKFMRVRRELDEQTKAVVDDCLEEFLSAVSYKACYRYFDIAIDGDKVSFSDCMTLHSEKLCQNLSGCKGAFVFVATTGSGVDRLIHKHQNVRVSRAVIIDAIGSAAIESLCDALTYDLENEYGVEFTPRFSPGYSDLSILCQKDILKNTDAMRKIGVTLTEHNLMVPMKSVSAIMGVK